MKTLIATDLEKTQPEIEQEVNRLFPSRCIQRVLLVIPPDADRQMFNYATAKRGRYWNFPPYGPGLLATHLRTDGIEVDLLNLNDQILKACQASAGEEEFDFDREWMTVLTDKIREFSPDLVGISCMFSQTHDSTVTVSNEIRSQFPQLPISLGGVHITNCLVNEDTSASFVKDFSNVNFFFTYESELAIKTFVNFVNGEIPTSRLTQVCFNIADEQIYCSERSTPGETDLDAIPAYDIMNISSLSLHGKIGSFYCHIKPDSILATSLSNRGCRAQCTFCSVRNFNGVGVRSRSVQSVIDELLVLRDQYGVNHIMWLDDDLRR